MSEVVLVTGGSGLVGSAIKRVVDENDSSSSNYKYVFLSSRDADLSDYNDAKRVFELHKPTYVVHLAAMVGGLFKNMSNNLDFFRVNMKINDHVLQLSAKSHVKKCVSCLSTCIFPDKTSYPIDESMVSPALSFNNIYATLSLSLADSFGPTARVQLRLLVRETNDRRAE